MFYNVNMKSIRKQYENINIIKFERIIGDINVKIHSEDKIMIQASSDPTTIKNFEMQKRGKQLKILQKPTEILNILNVFNKSEKLIINILAPENTNIDFNNVIGKVKIGDVKSILNINTSGSFNLRAGTIKSIKAKINGNGEINVDKILEGPAKVKINGSGILNIKNS